MRGRKTKVEIVIQIVIILLLVFLYSIFSAAETAILSIDKDKIDDLLEQGDSKAKIINDIKERPKKFLATTQLLCTFSIVYICFVINKYIYNKINNLIVAIIISYIIILLGNVFPRRLATSKGNKIAYSIVLPINIIVNLITPFTKIIMLFMGHAKDKSDTDDKVDSEEKENDDKTVVSNGEEYFVLDEDKETIKDGEDLFEDKKIEKVMTPRTNVYCIDIQENLNEYLDEMLEKRFSRIPVYEEDIDNIIGILYIKDFYIEAKNKGINNVNVREILKEAYFVPEIKRVKDVFLDMQKAKIQMAVVIDEYGGFSGIVTMEDLVEEIMGDIDDAYEDRDDYSIRELKNNKFLAYGMTTLEEINEKLGTNIQSEDVDTLSGYLINKIGNIPTKADERRIEEENLIFNIVKVSDKTIQKVIITKMI